MDWEAILHSIVSWAVNVGLKIVISLIAMLISFKIINRISKRIEKSVEKRDSDKTVTRTLAYIFKIGMKIVVIICLIGYLGIDTSGFTALVTSLGVCVGLAVNGALSNLAGGVLIIVTRPFRIDDFIEAQGFSGTVSEIHMTNTKLITGDNKVVYIPNGALSSGSIVNYSLSDTRRVDTVFSVTHDSDHDKAMEIIRQVCKSHPLTLNTPEPFVRISDYTPTSVNITARVWTKNSEYWTVKFDLVSLVKKRFDEEGIKIRLTT